jgi:hypothetical protein
MKSFLPFLAVLLMACSYAISLDEYIYPNESSALTHRDFNFSGTNYRVYSISGQEAFLVDRDGDALVTDTARAVSVIRGYYSSVYMTTPSEKDAIIATLDAFNASRNNGEVRPNQEEYACRELMAVGHGNEVAGSGDPDGKMAIINNNIDFMAIYIANDWLGGGDYADVNKLKGVLLPFFNATFGMDRETTAARAEMEALNESNAYATLGDVRQRIDRMDKYRTTLEKTVLRVPKVYGECVDCIGICYYIEMNKSALDSARSMVAAAEAKAKNLSNAAAVANRIVSTTNDRVNFIKNKDLRSYYSIKLAAISSYWVSVFPDLNASMAIINDPALNDKVSGIRSGIGSMNSSMNSFSFSGIDAQYNETGEMIASALSTAADDRVAYEALMNASAQADIAALLSSDGRTAEQKAQLDAQMGLPIGYETALNLTAEYLALVNRSSNTTSSSLSASEHYGLLAARVMNGFYLPLDLVERGTIRPYEGYMATAAPLVMATGMCALVAIFTAGGYSGAKRRYGSQRAAVFSLGPGAVVMLVIVLLSAGLYAFAPSVTDAKGPLMFMAYSAGKPIYVIANTGDTGSAMYSCAEKIVSAINASGGHASVATYDGSVCRMGGKAYATDCVNRINDATVSLAEGNFSVSSDLLIIPELEISGNSEDFARCAVAKQYEEAK